MSEVSGTSEVPDQHIAKRVGKRIISFLGSRLPGEKTKRDIVQYDRLIGNLPEEPKAIAEAIRPVVRAGMYAGNCVGTAFEGMVVLSFGVGAVAFIREGHRRGYGEVIGSIYRPDLSRPGQTIVRNFFDAIGGKRGRAVVDRSGVPAILELEEVLRRTKAPDDWVMLSDGRIVTRDEGGHVVFLPGHPALDDSLPDDSYFASLPVSDRRLIEGEVKAIRESLSTPITKRKRKTKDLAKPSAPRGIDLEAREHRRSQKHARAGVSSDRGKIKEALALEHRWVMRRALGMFAKGYGEHKTEWNERVAKAQAVTDPTGSDQHRWQQRRFWGGEQYEFAHHYWRLVRSEGGWDQYKEKVSQIRSSMAAAISPGAPDGSGEFETMLQKVSDVFGGVLGTIFPKGEQDGLSRFLYELTQLEAFRDGP